RLARLASPPPRSRGCAQAVSHRVVESLQPAEETAMPIHDWTRVDAGWFHAFHQDWTIELRRSLNAGRLPPGYLALTDQQIGGPIPDVLTLQRGDEVEEDTYARRANRIRIQHRHGQVVAVIEIVSPGNKNSRNGLR